MMTRDDVLEKVTKVLSDETGTKLVTGFARFIFYLWWTGRQLRRSREALAKLRQSEELTPKEARQLIKLLSWLAWTAATQWFVARRDLEKWFSTIEELTSRLETARESRHREREEALSRVQESAREVREALRKTRTGG